MTWFRVIWTKLRGLGGGADREFDGEIELHLSLLADRFMRQGMTAEDARSAARRQFGSSLRLKEDCAGIRTFVSIEAVWQDLRFGARSLARSPGFATAAVVTLALGLGINTAIFSVVKTVLLDRMPYREPDRLVMISEDASNAWENSELDYTMAAAWRSRATSFEGISAYRHSNTVLLDGDKGEIVVGLAVTYDFFDTLGVKMQLGRNFTASEDRPGPRRVVILTDGLWARRFGSDPGVVGRILRSDAGPLTVIGVLPAGFEALIKGTTELDPEMYLPLDYDSSAQCLTCQGARVVGRMKHDAGAGQARAELDGILQDAARAHPEAHGAHAHAGLIPARVRVFGRFGAALWVVTGAAAFVLLIACANLANLLLVKGTARARETALRAALGASGARLARQFLTESLLLASAGGAAGLLLAYSGTRALAWLAPAQIPRAQHAHLDATGLLFGFALTVATGFASGMAPAWRALLSTSGLVSSAVGGTSRSPIRNVLVVAELALAFVLATGAGLMLRTFLNLMRVDPGYQPAHVLTLTTSPWGERYENHPEARFHYYQQALERIRAIPGVEQAAITNIVPMDHAFRRRLQAEGVASDVELPIAGTFSVSPGYFRTLQIPLRRGRAFTEQDNRGTSKVAVINETCARLVFPNGDPIGRHVRLGTGDDVTAWVTIVGVAGDVRQFGLDRAPDAQVYLPFFQTEMWGGRLVARTVGDPLSLETQVREAFAAGDSLVPVYHVKALEEYVKGRLAERRFALALLALFGVLALGLAAVGAYGVISYSTSRRTRETGIRIALGATRQNLMLLVMRDGLALTAYGLAAGFALSLAMTRLLTGLLFEVSPTDAITTALTAAILAFTALAATFFPARRASRMDPVTALRHE